MGLGSIHISLAEYAAGADGQEASVLLPADSQGIQAVVKENTKAIDHVLHGLRDQIQKQQCGHGAANTGEQQREPSQGKARRESHA